MNNYVGLAAVGILLLAACGDDSESPADQPEPTELEHGECSIGSDGRERCECDSGYVGKLCDDCDTGFIFEGDECVRDSGPAPQPTCPAGYTGSSCSDCAARYHRNGGSCVRDERCTSDSCPEQASCDDSSGSVVCECFEGYSGEDCTLCAAGYHENRGSCVPNENCESNSCSEHGTCDDSDGVVVCICDPGFEGTRCTRCAMGFFAAGDGCDATPTCGPGSCSNRGACTESARGLACTCEEGYAGDECEECADDFVLANGVCVPLQPDAQCGAGSCSASGTCDDSSGVAVCTCYAGYTGLECQVCVAGSVKDSAGQCRISRCGDGIRDRQAFEDCDDDNTATEECPYTATVTPCTVCQSNCDLGPGIPNYCGDGNLDEGETCDDGANNGTYHSGATTGYCNADCTGYGPYCGDGVVDEENEECDLGTDAMAGNSDSIPDRCRTTCNLPSCGDGVVDEEETCDDGGEDGGCPSSCVESEFPSCDFTLTQSSDTMTITALNSVSCNSISGHSANEYLRTFDLDALGIVRFDVTQVRVGIEEGSGPDQPLSVRIYSTAVDPPALASLTLVEEESYTLAAMSGATITVPIEATVQGPAGTHLVASLFTPDGQTAGNHLFIGSNTAPETQDGYLLANDCGITEFTAIGNLGFPDMNILVHVDGTATGPICEED